MQTATGMAANLPTSSKASHEELRNEKEGQSHDLTEAEQEILAKQLNLLRVKASYFMLYRYATNIDLFIILISTFFAIVAGVIFPLMTVSPLPKNL
jgi:ATP-binding cassette, subfamily B (MDR/TAP), member 1